MVRWGVKDKIGNIVDSGSIFRHRDEQQAARLQAALHLMRKCCGVRGMLKDMECTDRVIAVRVCRRMGGEAFIANVHRATGDGIVVVQAHECCLRYAGGKCARAAADIQYPLTRSYQCRRLAVVSARCGSRRPGAIAAPGRVQIAVEIAAACNHRVKENQSARRLPQPKLPSGH